MAGATIGLTLTFRDVTEERAVSQMKSDFVSFVTHQLRTPLAGIKWLLELTAQGGELPDTARSFVEDAREANERLIRLVNDLLNVSRLESGKIDMTLEPTDLRGLTAAVVAELQGLVRDKGHHLTLDADPLPLVRVDRQLLRQVILNLLANAIKYTKPGGRVAVHLAPSGGRGVVVGPGQRHRDPEGGASAGCSRSSSGPRTRRPWKPRARASACTWSG